MKRTLIVLPLLFISLLAFSQSRIQGKPVVHTRVSVPVKSALATAHFVSLSWTQSTSTGVTANKVYRCAGVGCTNYSLLFTSSTPITTYTDNSVAGGITYDYVVSAMVSTSESPNSNQASTTIPSNPNAPTSLTVTGVQ